MAQDIIITLKLTVDDLPQDEIDEATVDADCDADDLAMSGDVEAADLEDGIVSMLTGEPQQEYIWAGSGLYARITAAEVIHSA